MTNTPEMRRPPQLWEQRLTKVTSIVATGMTASGATSLAPPDVPPATGGNFESAAVTPPPGAFIKPSTPTLVGGLQGINVLWDGLNSAGDLWPYDTSFVEVHMATSGTGFTPGTATLKGRLARPGNLFVGGLTAGTTYHFRLMGADAEGNVTDPSDAASGLTGLTTANDYGTATIGSGAVSFNARSIGGVTNTVGSTEPSSPLLNDVWLDSSPGTAIIHKIWNGSTWVTNAWGSASIAAGQITALQIAAGAITAGAIAADAITGKTVTGGTVTGAQITGNTITGGTITGGFITGGTITGALIQSTSISGYATSTDIANFITGSDVNSNVTSISGGVITSGTIIGRTVMSAQNGKRIVLNSADNQIDFYDSGGTKTSDLNPASIRGVNGLSVTGALDVDQLLDVGTDLYVGDDVFITGDLEVDGALTGTSTSVPNVRINTTTGEIKQTTHANSAQRFKHDIVPLSDAQLADVMEPERLGDPMAQAVDPTDVLSLVPVQYRRDEDPATVVTGFIADDVEVKFPTAVTYDDNGDLETIDVRGIVAGLLAVVQQQQATITDLRTRIEALEA